MEPTVILFKVMCLQVLQVPEARVVQAEQEEVAEPVVPEQPPDVIQRPMEMVEAVEAVAVAVAGAQVLPARIRTCESKPDQHLYLPILLLTSARKRL
jgi:hypothetical protein